MLYFCMGRYDIETLTIDKLLNKGHFNGKIMQKMCIKKLVPGPFLILANNPKQQFYANSFKNKIF